MVTAYHTMVGFVGERRRAGIPRKGVQEGEVVNGKLDQLSGESLQSKMSGPWLARWAV